MKKKKTQQRVGKGKKKAGAKSPLKTTAKRTAGGTAKAKSRPEKPLPRRTAGTGKVKMPPAVARRVSEKVAAPASSGPEATGLKPKEVGLAFLTENELAAYFAAGLTKKAEDQVHHLADVQDLGCLKFDWNTRALDEEHVGKLAQSVKLRGIMEPIVIAADYTHSARPVFQVVRGHHRTEAMRQLRKKVGSGDIAVARANLRLPAEVVIYRGEDDYRGDKRQQWGDAASNIPELIKKDDVFARADYFKDVLSSLAKGSTGKVAKSLGLSRSTIRDAMNVLELPPALQDLLRANVKVLREKFIYKTASKYSKVRRLWLKELKDKAAASLNVVLPTRTMTKPSGAQVTIKGPVPAEHREAYLKVLGKLKTREADALETRQKEREKELVKIVKAEIAAEKGEGRRAGATAGGGSPYGMPVVKKAFTDLIGRLSDEKQYSKADLVTLYEGMVDLPKRT